MGQPSDMLASLEAPFAPESVPEVSQPAEGADKANGGHDMLLDTPGLHPAVDSVAAPRGAGLTPQAVSSMLLMLELKGEIEAHAGGRYARRRCE